MGQNTTVLGIIAVVVIIVVFLSPTLIVAGQNLLNDLFEGWSSFWSNVTGSGGTGNTDLGATIHFKDGTTEEIKPSSILPLSVFYNEKEIASVDFILYAYFKYTGELSSVAYNGEVRYDATGDAVTDKTGTVSGNLPAKGPIPETGEYYPYGKLTISAQELHSWVSESGEYDSYATGKLTLILTFEDGTQQTLASQAHYCRFSYVLQESEAFALTVYISSQTTP